MLDTITRVKLYRDLKKPAKRIKFFYYFTVVSLLFLVFFISNTRYLYGYDIKVNVTKRIVKLVNNTDFYEKNNTQEIKYILLWTTDRATPFVYFGKGQSIFVKKKCQWTNCFVTSDRNYLGYYTEFEVIAFNGPQLSNIKAIGDIPTRRSRQQKYVFANIEAAANYPIPSDTWNGFFNWTWTYKLDSDAIWGYMAVRNASKHVIGPSTNIHWINLLDMDPITDKLKEKLKSKNKAAAWFNSNCNTLSLREEYVNKVQEQLKRYDLQIDIYGSCGKYQCPKENMDKCLNILEKHYYFYFAFENAFSEDYVTEKIVFALNHDTVPVVFGGANYSRFLPHGTYLNALEFSPQGLAKKMNEIIQNPTRYHNFFRWKKYYSFHFRNESPDTDDYCRFCAMLNDENLLKSISVYERLDYWWTGNNSEQQDQQEKKKTYCLRIQVLGSSHRYIGTLRLKTISKSA